MYLENIKAVNPKNQKAVDRFLKLDAAYSRIVDATEDCGGRKQEQAYEKAAEAFICLPAYEQKNLGDAGLGY